MSQILGLDSLLGTPELWPWLLAVILLPAVFQVSTLPICPESPKFILLNRGKEVEAQQGQSSLMYFVNISPLMLSTECRPGSCISSDLASRNFGNSGRA